MLLSGVELMRTGTAGVARPERLRLQHRRGAPTRPDRLRAALPFGDLATLEILAHRGGHGVGAPHNLIRETAKSGPPLLCAVPFLACGTRPGLSNMGGRRRGQLKTAGQVVGCN